ncbi:hypothetical protein ACTNEW_15140 [Blautia sp. HCP3S3_G3]
MSSIFEDAVGKEVIWHNLGSKETKNVRNKNEFFYKENQHD